MNRVEDYYLDIHLLAFYQIPELLKGCTSYDEVAERARDFIIKTVADIPMELKDAVQPNTGDKIMGRIADHIAYTDAKHSDLTDLEGAGSEDFCFVWGLIEKAYY